MFVCVYKIGTPILNICLFSYIDLSYSHGERDDAGGVLHHLPNTFAPTSIFVTPHFPKSVVALFDTHQTQTEVCHHKTTHHSIRQ